MAGRHKPTVRHFHNQPELQRGGSRGLMLRWFLLVCLASCGPLGNTVKQDAIAAGLQDRASIYGRLARRTFVVKQPSSDKTAVFGRRLRITATSTGCRVAPWVSAGVDESVSGASCHGKAIAAGLQDRASIYGRLARRTFVVKQPSSDKTAVFGRRLRITVTSTGCRVAPWVSAGVDESVSGASCHGKGCAFPSRWHGRWFQSGVIQPILIEGDRLSNKGRCLSSEGDKFLIVDEKGCYRCVVMHEKHTNVLQYKETFCHRRDALPHLCSLITGDALLYSMFRENADPVDCPLKGPFSFTYNRGHGDCKIPVSSIESCTEDSRLLLNYQACPDISASESTVEELECLATWKEGSLRFLVGKLHHNHATSNEDRYRCFVYEKTNGIASTGLKEGPSTGDVEYRVAQSGDATCNGLFSATEGSRTMALKRVSVRFNCQFPTWMTFSHTWHTLDFSSNYTFYQRNATLRITDQSGADIKVYCVNVKASSPSGNSVALVAHWQHHCASRYVCVVLYRRDTYIAELQRGSPTSRPDEACSNHHFNAVTAPYITLVASNPESKECPYSGKYEIQNNRHERSVRSTPERKENPTDIRNGSRLFNFSISNMSSTPILRSRRQANEVGCVVSGFSRLEVGCNSVKNMEFYSSCENKEVITAYTCHGGWYENGASFVVTTPVTRDSTAARRYCFVSRDARAALAVTRSANNCERVSKGGDQLVFNARNTGECQDQTNSQFLRLPSPHIVIMTAVILHYIIPR